MSDSVNNVSDPLKHLFSLDFSRTSPPLNEIALHSADNLNISRKQKKRVRFAEPFVDTSENLNQRIDKISELKGILKRTLSLEEKEYSLANLNIDDDSYDDDYTDFSSAEENSTNEDNSDNYNNDILQTGSKNDHVKSEEFNEEPDKITSSTFSDSNEETQGEITDAEYNVNEILDNKLVAPKPFKQEFSTEIKSSVEESPIHKLVCQKVNNHILNVLSKVKAESEKNSKFEIEKLTLNPIKATKHHFCISSTSISKSTKISGGLHSRNYSSSTRYVEIKKALNNNLKNYSCNKKAILDYNGRFLTSQETLKLFALLNDNSELEFLSAKELRSAVFKAWYEVKKEKLLTDAATAKISEEKNEKQKNIKPTVITNGHLNWKRRKEYRLKTRKRNNMKSKQQPKLLTETISEEEKKQNDELKTKIYNSWKKKKDEELKLKLQKEKQLAEINKSNELKNEELKKQDAASAFYAWKTMKINLLTKKQEEMKNIQQKINEDTLTKKAERDKDAQNAYFEWLKGKEKLKSSHPYIDNDRPPWNPPG